MVCEICLLLDTESHLLLPVFMAGRARTPHLHMKETFPAYSDSKSKTSFQFGIKRQGDIIKVTFWFLYYFSRYYITFCMPLLKRCSRKRDLLKMINNIDFFFFLGGQVIFSIHISLLCRSSLASRRLMRKYIVTELQNDHFFSNRGNKLCLSPFQMIPEVEPSHRRPGGPPSVRQNHGPPSCTNKKLKVQVSGGG